MCSKLGFCFSFYFGLGALGVFLSFWLAEALAAPEPEAPAGELAAPEPEASAVELGG